MASFNPFSRNMRRGYIPPHRITNFYGNNTELSDIKTMPDGFSPDSLNWITGSEKDCIILRRGTALLGQTRNNGAGGITGLGIGTRYDGKQIPFFSYARKVKYYDSATDDTIEVGLDMLPVAANGDEVSIFPYQNLAGAFVYLSSINSDIYKIPVANPGSAVAQNSTDYHGFLKFGQSRSILFNRRGSAGSKDVTGLYMSWVDKVSVASYSSLNQQTGSTGDGTTKTFTGGSLPQITGAKTLFQIRIAGVIGALTTITAITKAAAAQVTANGHGLVAGDSVLIHGTVGMAQIDDRIITVASVIDANNVTLNIDSTTFDVYTNGGTIGKAEVFIDDKNGGLLSPQGGTGTINYATSAYSVTFSVPLTSGAVIALEYYYEDATSHGVCDFSFAATRIAGTGRYFSQFDGGGPLNAVFPLANVFYGFHASKTWQTSIPTDDSDSGSVAPSNLPFREKMGVTYPYSAYGGATGVWFINNSNPNRPEVYDLRLFTGATASNIAAPTLISKALNLSSYAFDKAVLFQWGIYVILCFQQIRNGVADTFNSRMFLYNTKSGAWDLLDYPASRLAEYMGTLIAGDPLSNNIFTLFSGFDDDGSTIPNYWTSGLTNHGIPGQKVTHRMTVDGLIQATQNVDISVSYDGGNFVKVFTISGTGPYVDTGKSIAVGSYVEGSRIVGGGATVYANPFQVEFPLNSSRYEYIRIKIEATGGGYCQINYYEYKDTRYKGSRTLPERNASF